MADHELADALEPEEAGVALVGVEHLGLDAERFEGAHAADAEQDLLLQPVLGVAAVQPVGDGAQLGRVLVDVGVEQVQRHPADVGAPHLGDERPAAQLDRDAHPVARGDGHGVRVEVGVGLLLPAVAVERLAEVAVPVEQADADEGHAEVAGGLEVVAGQHPEATGVLRERLGDAELGREVGDAPQGPVGLGPGLEPAGLVEVAAELGVDLGEEAQERRVVGQGVEPVATDQPEQPHRVVDGGVPGIGIDPAEEVAGLRVPGPPEVDGELFESRELLGEAGTDGETAEGLHVRRR